MHELSVVMGILNIAKNETAKAGAKAVEIIELEIGTLAGIEFDSLDFIWPSAVKNTVLENAIKKIDVVQAKGKCMECDTVFDLEHVYDPCPKCNNYLKGILQGKELRVKSLEVV